MPAAAPLNLRVTPLPAGSGETVPEIVTGTAAKSTPDTPVPDNVTVLLDGLNAYPALVGVTVYVPFDSGLNE